MKNSAEEVFYHVFQRSFYDSNGDHYGDFRGLASKLDYIQDLGATAILILPIYESVFYHNYFATDFRKIDPTYGSLEDYFFLIDEIHRRGMKLFMDMEIQYVTEDHIWFRDSYQNPLSPYTEHVLYNGPGNTDPESIIFDLKEIHSYNGTVKKVACLNLFNPSTQRLLTEEFIYWTDPHRDGTFSHGVDGFRLDHMMDDLDDKGKLVGVYRRFWRPLIEEVRKVNPDIKFIGEQADWESNGLKGFEEADVDYMFAFPLKFAIGHMNKVDIIRCQESAQTSTPDGKSQILLLENHDTTRFASVVQSHFGKLRVGAALNLLLKGIPMIYYGQELGMEGEGGFAKYGISDGNDIPRRESFRWTKKVEDVGSTLWYKDSGPWWDDSRLADGNGISVEEQLNQEGSLLEFYKNLIQIRKEYKAISSGSIEFLQNSSDFVISFVRFYEEELILINISLSSDEQSINLEEFSVKETIFCFPQEMADLRQVAPYAIQIFKVRYVQDDPAE